MEQLSEAKASCSLGATPENTFRQAGFLMLENFVPAENCDQLAADLSPALNANPTGAISPRGGLRNLLGHQSVRAFARWEKLRLALAGIMKAEPFPVRCIYFDKTPAANWAVAWHQDLQIAVAEKIETPGFGPWSVKAGVVHVQPPAEILGQMVTVRLHLDDCDESNGALQVIPGSHAHGILSDSERTAWRERPAVTCPMRRGGVLLMRPLLLHSSASATNPSHRRVLHLEYACEALPNGLRWNERS